MLISTQKGTYRNTKHVFPLASTIKYAIEIFSDILFPEYGLPSVLSYAKCTLSKNTHIHTIKLRHLGNLLARKKITQISNP